MATSSSIPFEKHPEERGIPRIEEETEALEGYVLDLTHYGNNAARLKTSPDGRYVLIPQPSDYPSDPLNWKKAKKIRIIAIVAYISLLADYIGGTAIMTIIPQAMFVSHTSRVIGITKADLGNGNCPKQLCKEPWSVICSQLEHVTCSLWLSPAISVDGP